MAEAHQARMQNVVEEMVQSLERGHIRKMQVGVSILFYYLYYGLSFFFSNRPIRYVFYYLPAGSYVQLQRRMLQSPLGLHVSGASVHRSVSHSSGSSSGTGHLRAGKVSGEGSSVFHLCKRCLPLTLSAFSKHSVMSQWCKWSARS